MNVPLQKKIERRGNVQYTYIYPHYPHICFMKATLQISERSYFSLILNNRSQYDNQSTVMNCCQGTFVVGGFRVGITDRMKVIKLRQHHTDRYYIFS